MMLRQVQVWRRSTVTLAARVLGSRGEAEEVVQEAWLRLRAADAESIFNLDGWLSTVVARAAIDRLRQRCRWAEIPRRGRPPNRICRSLARPRSQGHSCRCRRNFPCRVLDRLGPTERLAFMLHDLFGLAFDEVATVVGRPPTAARKLANRARRRLRAPAAMAFANLKARADIVAALTKASRDGKMEDLLRHLDPDVTLTIVPAALAPGVPSIVQGTGKVAAPARAGARASATEVMLVDGEPALVIATGGQIERILTFVIGPHRRVRGDIGQCEGKLVVPEVAGSEVSVPVAAAQAAHMPVSTASIDLTIGPVALRLDAATPAVRVAELVVARQAHR